jgi:hypothetical protein
MEDKGTGSGFIKHIFDDDDDDENHDNNNNDNNNY